MTHARRTLQRLLVAAAASVVLVGPAEPVRAQAQATDAARAEYMIKNTLMALNHANLTGNYTVLRDLGSPRFRTNNTAARLSAVFAPLRDQAIDMSPIVLFEPRLAAPIGHDDDGRLRLIGQFTTRPLRIVFDLAFETSGDRWSISDLSVNAVPWPEAVEDGQEQGANSPAPVTDPPLPRPRPAR